MPNNLNKLPAQQTARDTQTLVKVLLIKSFGLRLGSAPSRIVEQIPSLSVSLVHHQYLHCWNHSESRSLTEMSFTCCQGCSQLAQHYQLPLGEKQPAPTCSGRLLPHSTAGRLFSSFLSLKKCLFPFSYLY